VPGIWRLRLPLPWPGVPHCNAYAVAAGDGVVLFDCGLHEPGSLAQLERAMAQVGLALADVRLLVCTHAHADHYGQAASIVDAAGCELWMHPADAHMRGSLEDPEARLARRFEIARQSGVPVQPLRAWSASARSRGSGIARLVEPDRELVAGVTVDTDLGEWTVVETPGHAPSHVCLHEPESGLLISGDHLLGRVSLYYDYGWTPDPAGEFLTSLDTIAALDSSLCLPGHGRPFRDVQEHIDANRREVRERIERVRSALRDGEPKTPFEIVPILLGDPNPSPMMVTWGLSETLAYLDHLEQLEEAHRVDTEPADRWALAA